MYAESTKPVRFFPRFAGDSGKSKLVRLFAHLHTVLETSRKKKHSLYAFFGLLLIRRVYYVQRYVEPC